MSRGRFLNSFVCHWGVIWRRQGCECRGWGVCVIRVDGSTGCSYLSFCVYLLFSGDVWRPMQ